MIQKIIRRFFKKNSSAGHDPVILPLRKHGISREHISPCALKVCDELRAQGFAAFVVGGAVRDLLLGMEPKDYDVATDATPEQVRDVFRRSRIIGRRFRIVHVMCGRETIEVTTFRGPAAPPTGEEEEGDDDNHRQSDSGRLLRDNVFGSQYEDAVRRDFTVNALYYDPAKQEVWDYLHGVADAKHSVLRIIGDAETRFREDPVRMLRAVRLAAKLEFKIDAATKKPIKALADLLQEVPKSRLFDEMLKMFHSGHALASAHRLREEGLHHGLLPLLDAILEQPMGERFITLALKSTDERVREDKPVSPAFLFASLLWHEVLTRWEQYQQQDMRPLPALNEAMDDVIQTQVENLAIPRRYTATMREIWSMQPRFLQRAGQRPFRLVENPKFRAGFDFLLLRCGSGEVDAKVGQWWETFQHASDAERERMLIKDEAPPRKRRRRGKKPESATLPAED
ncbi:MAG: poly(A) polymerase [Betaproteobacteria bacterium RBG_16_58_11]|nr:MAG: poly(A) polymerase [Betaproteobacteria bacterium RBG_16_58_11]